MQKSGLAFFTLLGLTPALVHAQSAAPAMSGVKEVVVQYAQFTNPKTADACSLVREELGAVIDKTLAENNVPATSSAIAKPPVMGMARIELIPEITTINSQELDCTSWVSLTAESRSNVRVPPIDIPRSVTVVYWHQGALVASQQSSQERLVGETLKKMAAQFAQQYRIDQPPELPTGQ